MDNQNAQDQRHRVARISGYPAWNVLPTTIPGLYMRIPPGRGSQPGNEKYDLYDAEDIMRKAQREIPFPEKACVSFNTPPTLNGIEGRMILMVSDSTTLESAVDHLVGPMRPAFQRAVHNLVMKAKPRNCAFNLAAAHDILVRQDPNIARLFRQFTLDANEIEKVRLRCERTGRGRFEEAIDRHRRAKAVTAMLEPALNKHENGSVAEMLDDSAMPALIRAALKRALPALLPPESRF